MSLPNPFLEPRKALTIVFIWGETWSRWPTDIIHTHWSLSDRSPECYSTSGKVNLNVRNRISYIRVKCISVFHVRKVALLQTFFGRGQNMQLHRAVAPAGVSLYKQAVIRVQTKEWTSLYLFQFQISEFLFLLS